MRKKKNDGIFEEIDNATVPEEPVEKKTKKHGVGKKIYRFLDGVFGFLIATGIVVAFSCLALEYILVKGPSPALRDSFVMTMLETRRFDFIANVYLSEDEVEEIRSANFESRPQEMDMSLITINSASPETPIVDENGADAYGLVDEDGDGIIYKPIKGSVYQGYMIIVLDPTRVFVGKPDFYGGVGITLRQLCEKYDAIGGINAGGFKDDGGGGLGGEPEGLTIIDGEVFNQQAGESTFAGLDSNGILHVGYFNDWLAQQNDIVYGVSFGPLLIVNGEPQNIPYSGVNPRTAIAQRADGAIIMLAIDGRQAHSLGASYDDVIDLLLSYGAVNACNMDGGSSTCMFYNGEYVNSSSSAAGERLLPNAFMFR